MVYNKKGVDVGKRQVAIRVELTEDFDPDEMSAENEEDQFVSNDFKEPEVEDDDIDMKYGDDGEEEEDKKEVGDEETKKDVQKKEKAEKGKAWKVFILIKPTAQQKVKHFVSGNYHAVMHDLREFLIAHIDTILFTELRKKNDDVL